MVRTHQFDFKPPRGPRERSEWVRRWVAPFRSQDPLREAARGSVLNRPHDRRGSPRPEWGRELLLTASVREHTARCADRSISEGCASFCFEDPLRGAHRTTQRNRPVSTTSTVARIAPCAYLLLGSGTATRLCGTPSRGTVLYYQQLSGSTHACARRGAPNRNSAIFGP